MTKRKIDFNKWVLLLAAVPLVFIIYAIATFNTPPRGWVEHDLNQFSAHFPADWTSTDEVFQMISAPDADFTVVKDDSLLLRPTRDGGSPLSAAWIVVVNKKGHATSIKKSPDCENRGNFTTEFEGGFYECNDEPYGIGVVIDISAMPQSDSLGEPVGNRTLIGGFTCTKDSDDYDLSKTCQKIARTVRVVLD